MFNTPLPRVMTGLGFCAALAAVLFVQAPSSAQARAKGAEQGIQTKTFKPKPIKIRVDDLPEPYASESARKSPKVIGIPSNPTLQVPRGFKVEVYAKVPKARWLTLTPNGAVLCASSKTNKVYRLEDTNDDGKADKSTVFVDQATAGKRPFGMAFNNGKFYLANTAKVMRFDYDKNKAKITGNASKITDLTPGGYHGHWTRNVVLSPDKKHLFVSIGSASNVGRGKPPRASILRMKLDGSQREVYASGLRNPVGLDFQPKTKTLYTTVNERDRLGDDLVPDYMTKVVQGAFYGWPYAYLVPENLDPRRMDGDQSERPDLAAKTRTPDVLFQAHSAALGLAFYPENPEPAKSRQRGAQANQAPSKAFPEHYRGGAFVAFRGSWNRSRGTGYKIVYVPFDDQGKPKGQYEDFVRGFLTKPKVPATWGRPVGVLVLDDGSLLFTEEGHGRIYRVWYSGK